MARYRVYFQHLLDAEFAGFAKDSVFFRDVRAPSPTAALERFRRRRPLSKWESWTIGDGVVSRSPSLFRRR